MLTITRKYGESFFIDCPDGTRITVGIHSTHKSKAVLKIDGPREYRVIRSEVLTAASPTLLYKPANKGPENS